MDQHTFSSHGKPFSFRCTMSPSRRVSRKEENSPLGRTVLEYAHDNAGHLLEVRRNGICIEKYTYDDQGRRSEDYRSWSGGSRHFIYGYDGALIRVNDAYLEWTPQGQLRAIQANADRMEYEYGDDTRLDQIGLPSGMTVQYEYGSGLMPVRVLEDREPVYEYAWQDDTRLRQCIDIRNGLTYDFSYGKGRVPQSVHVQAPAHVLRSILGTDASSLRLRVWVDQVGSIRVLGTEDGRVLKALDYDAFGNVTHETRTQWHFPLGFACGLNDVYTGFVRFGYRDYDPQVGRFTAKDPIGYTGGDNDLWDYCVDDPVGNLDPKGLLGIKAILSATHTGANIAGMGLAGLAFPAQANEPEKIISIREEYDRLREKGIQTDTEGYRLWQLWQEDMRLREKYRDHYEKLHEFYKDYPPIK